MAMDRQQMLSILNTMSEDNLAEALSAVGVECDYDGMDLGEESAEGLESWNARDVSLEPANKPEFLDKSKFVKKAEPMARDREYFEEPRDDSAALNGFLADQQGY